MLFIYGTLRKGGRNRQIIEPFLKSSTEAHATGNLYKCGKYPLFYPNGVTNIVGELVELIDEEKAFEKLDPFEGPEYVREKITVTSGGKNIEAWTYICANLNLLGSSTLIESGDWLEFMTAK